MGAVGMTETWSIKEVEFGSNEVTAHPASLRQKPFHTCIFLPSLVIIYTTIDDRPMLILPRTSVVQVFKRAIQRQ